MARRARKISRSGMYHIILSGNNKPLFKSNDDKNVFLNLIGELCDGNVREIYAYCLLDNECSLLVKSKDISAFMKSLQIRYASFYNSQYAEKGRLFKDRFKSICIETDEEFAENLRYIHQYPEIKGEVSDFRDFEYSSFDEYNDEALICDTDYINKMGKFDFNSFHNVESGIKMKKRVVVEEEEAKKLVYEFTGGKDIMKLQERNEILVRLKEKGLSVRQIARLTGINRGPVFNAKIPEEKKMEIFLL